jgi:hypothetical protein
MAVVTSSDTFLDEPLSPELVLVSPPEIARLARERLWDMCFVGTLTVPRAEAPSPVKASFARRNVGLAGFYLFCLLTTVGPLVLTILLGFYR